MLISSLFGLLRKCQGFSCQPCMCVMACIAFIPVCDDNMLCLLCTYSLACFTLSCMISECWLHPCLLVCLDHACLCHQASLQDRISFEFTSIYIHETSRPTFGSFSCLARVICNSIQWIYNHNPNPHLLHMSICVSLFLCLLACFLFFVCLLACIPISLCLLLLLFFLLCCVCVCGVCLCCMWWIKYAPYFQATIKKGIDQQILGDQPFHEVHSFLPFPLEP